MLKLIKFMQAKRLEYLEMMTSEIPIKDGTDKMKVNCLVVNNNINEEVGQVRYIFSDLTGTLTKREMRFYKMIVGRYKFDHKVYNKDKKLDEPDPALLQMLKDPGNEGERVRYAMKCLMLCHNAYVSPEGDSIVCSQIEEQTFLDFCSYYRYVYKIPIEEEGRTSY